ncbi:hypothetical protein GQX74_015025 [Glossina fuscipes]|nr:hypothetical protein GQX74_015025 [Glossina fuscipes]
MSKISIVGMPLATIVDTGAATGFITEKCVENLQHLMHNPTRDLDVVVAVDCNAQGSHTSYWLKHLINFWGYRNMFTPNRFLHNQINSPQYHAMKIVVDDTCDSNGIGIKQIKILPSYDDSTITEDDESSDQHGCYALYVTIEMDSVIKSSSLEIDNNSVAKRHQRPGIVVAGFPASLDNVVGVVIKIEFALNVNISPNDITTCDLLKKQNRLIVKFNKTMLKDAFMKNYFAL